MVDDLQGTVTLLFTDIEGSTRLLQRLGSEAYSAVLADHHAIIRSALAANGGIEVKTEGDSFFAAFTRATDAISAAVDIQRTIGGRQWPSDSVVAVRMGMHTGEIGRVANEYVGLDIHRAARIEAAAHGGQVVISAATRELVGDRLPDAVSAIDLGEHRLKDIDRPEHLYQLVITGLRNEFPPLRSLATRLDLLPAETTTFVGREREVAEARALLSHTRLLTLTGPGGTGKTRLALRLAREVADTLADGEAFVPLAAISAAELVPSTIRQALRFAEETGRTALETLVERLREREALIVLDNFEQVLPAAPSVATLLEGCERLKLVVTSRSALHISGEQEYGVPPLGVPAAATDDLNALAAEGSVALFVERAHSVRPDFALSASNAAAVVAICRRLDGLPLAIELAASRIKLLPPQALLARLGNSLDLLQTTAADRTDRQRTLRGAIDWSYRLLEEEQRRLFRRLGIFVGGWRLDDADAVVSASGADVDILEGLAGLVDQSLLRSADSADEDEPRYIMLETIREYALGELASEGELERAAADHSARFADLVRTAEPELTGGPAWLDRFDGDQANVRAAVAWLADHDMERALTMAGSLWRFWQRRGHLREGAAVLSRLLERPDAQRPTAARAKALIGLAGVVYWQLDYPAAQQAYEAALDIARTLADDRLQADVLYSLAYTQSLADDLDGAQQRADDARVIYERLHDEMGIASSGMTDAMIAALRGEHDRGLGLMDAAIETFRRGGNDFGLTNTLGMKVRSLIELGRNDEARAVNREHLRTSLEQRDPTALTSALLDAASLEALAGNLERAARLIGAGQRQIDEAGGEPPPELVRRIELVPLLERGLEPARRASLVAEGRQMHTDAAVAYALEAEN